MIHEDTEVVSEEGAGDSEGPGGGNDEGLAGQKEDGRDDGVEWFREDGGLGLVHQGLVVASRSK